MVIQFGNNDQKGSYMGVVNAVKASRKIIIVGAFWRSWNMGWGKSWNLFQSKNPFRSCAIAPTLREIGGRKPVTREETTGKNASRVLRPGAVRGCCCCVTRRDRQRKDEEAERKKETRPPHSPAAAHSALVNRNRKREWECEEDVDGRSKWTTVLHIMRPNEANAASQHERPTQHAFRSLQWP